MAAISAFDPNEFLDESIKLFSILNISHIYFLVVLSVTNEVDPFITEVKKELEKVLFVVKLY